jgi:hypothetical protein
VDIIKIGEPILQDRVTTMPVHKQPIRIVVPIPRVKVVLRYLINRGQSVNRTRTVSRPRTISRGNDHRTNRDHSILNKIADRTPRGNQEIPRNRVLKGIIHKEIVPAVLVRERLQGLEPTAELPDP